MISSCAQWRRAPESLSDIPVDVIVVAFLFVLGVQLGEHGEETKALLPGALASLAETLRHVSGDVGIASAALLGV